MRAWDLADHWPMRASIDGRVNPLAGGGGAPREVFRGLPYRAGPKTEEQWAEQTQQWRDIQSSNYWAPLLELVEGRRGFWGGPRLPLVMPRRQRRWTRRRRPSPTPASRWRGRWASPLKWSRRPACASPMCQRGTAARCASGCAPTGG